MGKDDFKYFNQEFDMDVLNLVKQKGFNCQELPSKEKFDSSLTDKKISDKEYDYVLKIWNKFEMKTIKDYHILYLKCDVLLLGDFLEEFRNNSLNNYGLCPSYYLSALALNWDAMLNMTKVVKLELIPHPDMHIFFEKRRQLKVNVRLI